MLHCAVCGSTEVEIVEWINPNTREITDGEPFISKWSYAASMGMTYCHTCDHEGRDPNPEMEWRCGDGQD